MIAPITRRTSATVEMRTNKECRFVFMFARFDWSRTIGRVSLEACLRKLSSHGWRGSIIPPRVLKLSSCGNAIVLTRDSETPWPDNPARNARFSGNWSTMIPANISLGKSLRRWDNRARWSEREFGYRKQNRLNFCDNQFSPKLQKIIKLIRL